MQNQKITETDNNYFANFLIKDIISITVTKCFLEK